MEVFALALAQGNRFALASRHIALADLNWSAWGRLLLSRQCVEQRAQIRAL
jgi:hypothetical protein